MSNPRIHPSTRRGVVLGATLVGGLCVALAPASGQGDAEMRRDGFAGWAEMEDPSFVYDPDRKGIRAYQPRAPAEVRLLFSRAQQLVEGGSVNDGLRLFQQIVDQHGHAVYQVASERFVGAAEYARFLLRGQPRSVRQAYESWSVVRDEGELIQALETRDEPVLQALARKWANASVGQRALLTLGRLSQLRGDRELAAAYAGRVLDFIPSEADAVDESAVEMRRQALMLWAAASGRTPSLVRTELDARVKLRGDDRSLVEAVADVTPPTVAAPDHWPTYGGAADRARPMHAPDGSVELANMTALDSRPEAFRSGAEENGAYPDLIRRLAPGDDRLNPLPRPYLAQPPLQPVRLGERLLINNSLSVKAYNLYSRKLEWEFQGPLMRQIQGHFPVTQYTLHRTMDSIDNPISKGLITGLTVQRGVVLANVQVPEPQRKVDSISQITINPAYPWRGLVALDLEDGSLLWSQRGEVEFEELSKQWIWDASELPDGGRTVASRLDVLGPPAVVDDRVFALGHFIEGAVNSHLMALNLRTGRPEFTVPLVIGQQELSMFNMPFQEFTTGTPAVGDGVILCPTNLGLVAAVDLVFGDLRWLAGYDSLPIRQPPNYYQNNPRTVLWYHSPPMVHDGVLLVTPHDSRYVHAIDAASGKLLWQHDIRRRSGYQARPSGFLLGVRGNDVIVQYEKALISLDLFTGRPMWDAALPKDDEAAGRGCVTDQLVFVPTVEHLLAFDRDGILAGKEPWPESARRRGRSSLGGPSGLDEPVFAGNVLAFPDMVIAANRDWVGVAFDPRAVLADLQERVLNEGEHPALLARIGSLHRRSGNLASAAKSFERALTLSSEGDAEVGRIRLQLCRTLIDRAESLLAVSNRRGALTELMRAEEVADDLETRQRITQLALEQLGAEAGIERILAWLEALRVRHGAERGSFPQHSSEPISIATYVAVERIDLLRGMERDREAMVELQRLHARETEEALGGESVREFARRGLESLLADSPPELRALYDEGAWEEFEAAFSDGDADRLGHLRRRYPGASRPVEFFQRFSDLLSAKGRHGEVIVAGSQLLQDLGRDEPEGVLDAMAAAALALDNQSLVRDLVRRGADVAGAPTALVVRTAEGPPVEERRFELADDEGLLGSREFPVIGEPLSDWMADYLLVTGDQSLTRRDETTDEVRWSASLPDRDISRFFTEYLHVAGMLAVLRGNDLLAFDLEDGSVAWRRRADDATVEEVVAVGGLLGVAESRPATNAAGLETLTLQMMEPRTGRVLWKRRLAGSGRREDLVLSGSTILAVTDANPVTVEVLDALSGQTLFQVPREVAISTHIAPAIAANGAVVVVPKNETVRSALQMRLQADMLQAYDVATGQPIWSLDLLPYGRSVRSMISLEGGLGLVVGGHQAVSRFLLTLDPRTGRVLREEELPSRIDEIIRPRGGPEPTNLLLGTARRVQVKEGRRLRILDGTGATTQSKTLEFPDGTLTADGFADCLQRGPQLLLFSSRLDRGGSFTDLLAMDARTGDVVARDSFPRSTINLVDSAAYLGRERVFVRVGRAVRVYTWK